MHYVKRYLSSWSLENKILSPKMIFVAGPRQAGKSTLLANFLKEKGCGVLLFNWDTPAVKALYRKDPLFFESSARLLKRNQTEIWVGLDEIHKRTHWKDILKGYYDQFQREFRFVVSGSARLDLFRKSGDSLIGRYFLFHLFPISLAEMGSIPQKELSLWQALVSLEDGFDLFRIIADTKPLAHDLYEQLYEFGPFPEPLLKADKVFANLWHRDYLNLYLREELRDLTRIADIDGVETLVSLLPGRVGSILSVNSLKEDLQVSHGTISNWLASLSKLYLTFSLSPWQRKVHKSIKKEKKYYFLDWTYIPRENSGPRFENMVAVGLMRLCNALNENGLGPYELHFVRDLSRREVDFLFTSGDKPVLLVEAKTDAQKIPPFAQNLAVKLGDIPLILLTHQSGILKKVSSTASIISAGHFFSCVP